MVEAAALHSFQYLLKKNPFSGSGYKDQSES